MTIDRHHYKYVYIDSSNHKTGNDFKVKVPHGLNSCTRVAVQTFSIPNTLPNTYGKLSKLYFAEYRKNDWDSGIGDWTKKVFYIDLSDVAGYTDNVELASILNEKILNGVYDYETDTLDHTFGLGDDPLEIVFAYDQNTYRFAYTVQQSTLAANDAGIKVFVPCFTDDDLGLWEHLGYSNKADMVALNSASYLTTPEALRVNFNAIHTIIYPTSADIPAGQLGVSFKTFNTNYIYARIAGVPNAENDILTRMAVGDGMSLHENHFSGLYICSDTLGTDSMISKNDTAVPTNVMCCLINDQPKYSYLHYQTNTLAWQKLNDAKIKEFDIKLRDHRGRDIPGSKLPHFNMTLIFEEIDEIEYHAEHQREYLREAYRKEHNYRK